MKKVIVIAALIVGLTAVLTAFDGMENGRRWQGEYQQNRMMRNGKMEQHRHGNELGFLCKNLDLTDAQKNKIETISSDHQKNMIQLNADIDILRIDEKNAMQEHDFTEAKKVVSKIYNLKEKMQLQKIDHQKAIWNELTEDQQKKMEELKHEFRPRKMMNAKQQHKGWREDNVESISDR